eukprot:2076078-Rhodomonas_salina.1
MGDDDDDEHGMIAFGDVFPSFTKDKAKSLAASNRALSKLLAHHRALAAERPTKMPKLRGARSATPQSGGRMRLTSLSAESGGRMRLTSLSAARADARALAPPNAPSSLPNSLALSATSAHDSRLR